MPSASAGIPPAWIICIITLVPDRGRPDTITTGWGMGGSMDSEDVSDKTPAVAHLGSWGKTAVCPDAAKGYENAKVDNFHR